MSKIISQIADQIATLNRVQDQFENANRSRLIVSLHGSLDQIESCLSKLAPYPYDLVEICPPSIHLLSLKKKIKTPWILTYKRDPLQSVDTYLEELKTLILFNPDMIDVDHEDFEKIYKELPFHGKWIISYHDFVPTPHSGAFLELLYEKLSRSGANFIKVALSPSSQANALSLLSKAEQVHEKEHKLFFVCIGERYSWTRILSSKWNVGATYCSLRGYERFGQLSIEELIETYSFYKHHYKTKLYALLGDPVEQSLSHRTHNQVFRELHLDTLYCKIPITQEEVGTFLEMAKFHFSGFSVTMPLKGAIVPREIINTIGIEHFHFSFMSSDAPSAVALVKQKNISPKSILILGSGSTAQAAAYAYYKQGWTNLTLLSRNPLHKQIPGINLIDEASCIASPKEYDLVMNTTPPQAQFSKELLSKLFESRPLFFEVNYNPSLTPLLEDALENGCQVIPGIELFAAQAAMQIAFWFQFNREEKEKIQMRILEIASSFHSSDEKLAAMTEKLPR